MTPAPAEIIVLQGLCLAGFAGCAAVTDARNRRVPNALVVPGLAVALFLRFPSGLAAVIDGLSGTGLGLVLGFSLFALNIWGAGDGKLLLMVGGYLGMAQMPGALALIAVIGGALALIQATRQGAILPVLLNVRRLLTAGGRSEPRIATQHVLTVPYGVAIASGAVTWWLLTAGLI
jgi:Flp pilus assembly protein protease CpaA